MATESNGAGHFNEEKKLQPDEQVRDSETKALNHALATHTNLVKYSKDEWIIDSYAISYDKQLKVVP